MMTPSNRAFRFSAGGNNYAIDIKPDAVYVLVERSAGWQAERGAVMSASASDIAIAGGPVEFARKIVEAVNALLRRWFANDAIPETPASIHDEVLDALRAAYEPRLGMDGVVQLQPKRTP